MQELDDNTLLRDYEQRNSEAAFAALVARHVDKVYSVALRHARNPHQAEEITQAVFVILAKKSSRLGKGVILEGWLYQTARLTALTLIRSEIRRVRREQEAQMKTALNENESEVWTQIAPLLDTAMASLNEADRHTVVLRFFYGKSMREVGAALGGSEGAARLRLHRAVEKLRQFFAKHGVTSTTEAITGAISANSVQAAPVMLAKSASAVATAAGAAPGSSTLTLAKGALKVMAWSKAKATIVVGVGFLLAAGTTTVVVKAHTATNRRGSARAQAGVLKESAFDAIMYFAKDHQDEIPKSMADLKPYLPAGADGIDDDHWQVSGTGKLTPLLMREDVILLEQKNVPPGKKAIILYTDGHVARK